jgi:hypothetical protein
MEAIENSLVNILKERYEITVIIANARTYLPSNSVENRLSIIIGNKRFCLYLTRKSHFYFRENRNYFSFSRDYQRSINH